MSPTVSVLMSVYNGARFIREAVDGILSQSFSDFEFIVIDDGSNDETGEILGAYCDVRMVIRRNSTNIGLPGSLNRGLSIARGEYVTRQDADDVSYPERLEEQVRFLDRNPKIAVLGTDYLHATSIFRREAITAAGGYSTETQAVHVEDYDLWSRLIWERYELANLSAPLVRVRCDPAGVSRSSPDLQYQNFRGVVHRNLQRLIPNLQKDPALAKLVWLLQVCGGLDEPLEQVERALKALDDLVTNFCGYFKLDSREQRRVQQMAHRRAAKTLLHNAQQYAYAGRDAQANEFAALALGLDKRLAFSRGYQRLRMKNLLGEQSIQHLRDARKRIKSAFHPS